jgi:hypothetical protein
MTRRLVTPAVIVALAASLLVVAPSIPSHAAARGGCEALANIPRPPTPTSTRSKLYAWGEIRCARASNVAIEICAVRFTRAAQTPDARLVWCVHETVKVAAGVGKPVRTRLHGCTPGKAYRSSIAIVGRPGDVGPYLMCRSF